MNHLIGWGVVILQEGMRNIELFGSLYDKATVFQAEVYAIHMASLYIKEANLDGKRVAIHSDSQAAIAALNSVNITAKTIKNCVHSLNAAGMENDITLKWVKAHIGIYGNEEADVAAKNGGKQQPGDSIPVPWSWLKNEARDIVREVWNKRWTSSGTCRQTKDWVPEVDTKQCQRAKKTVSLARIALGNVIQFITGHNYFNRHNSIVDRTIDSTCRFCGEDEESSWHLASECFALSQIRNNVFHVHVDIGQIAPKWSPYQINRFMDLLQGKDLTGRDVSISSDVSEGEGRPYGEE